MSAAPEVLDPTTALEMLRATYTYCADPDPDLPVVVSLFSGIEGIGAGLALSGFEVVVAVEWDPECQRVIRARFPNVIIYSDVREVDPDEIRKIVGGRRVILVGGFPCQDVSVAGGRAGVDGTRSGLYVELVRIAEALDPDWVVVENVAGLLSADLDREANDGAGWGRGTAMAVVLRDLCGWAPPVPADGWRNSGVCVGPRRSVAWRVLDARHTGVAQRRRRVFLVACPRDGSAPAAVLLEPEGLRGNPPPGEPPRPRSSRRVAPAAVPAGDPDAHRGGEAGSRPRVLADEGVVSSLTSSLGAGGPDAAHAHAGWMVPSEETVAAVTTRHHADRGDASDTGKLVVGVEPAPVAVRGRDGGSAAELGEPGVMNALRAGNGGSSRSQTVLVDDPTCVTGATTHALTSEGADASEDGTGRGTPIVAVPPPWRRGKRAVEAELDPDRGAFPIDIRAGLREDMRTGAGTQGTGIGEDGDPAPTLGVGSATPAVATFAKSHRASTPDDDESWVEAEVANTLNTFDASETRATQAVVEAYGFYATGGGQGEADGTDVAQTLKVGTGVGAPAAGAVAAYPISQDALRGGEGVAQTPSADAEGRVRLRDPGLGVYDDGDPAATVTAAGAGAVGITAKGNGECYGTDELAPALNVGGGQPGQGYPAVATFAVEPETGQGADLRARETDLSPAVTVTDHAKSTDRGVRVADAGEASVRRLTPTECERLQGFPDPWLMGLGLSDSAMYRQLGNAVCVATSGWIGWRVASYLRGWRP